MTASKPSRWKVYSVYYICSTRKSTKQHTYIILTFVTYFSTAYLTNAVHDDKCGSQEVTVGGVFSHNVLVPKLDRHKCTKQLAQLLNQQVELALDTTKQTPHKMKKEEGTSLASKSA